jgi:hypothetical protein
VQVILSPVYRPTPVFLPTFDPLAIGLWVRRVNKDGQLEDGLLMPDGRLWQDRREDGTQRFDLYFYKAQKGT